MYGSYHCSYTLPSKIHPKMLHTLRPHTPFCLEMEYKIARSPLPGNQILISKYLARRGVMVSGGWSNGSGWQQTTK